MNDNITDLEFIDHLRAKANYYEDKINSGIFFKLEPGKEPSEIIGVLELDLEKEFIKNVEVGYPANKELEKEIQTHLADLISEKP